MNLTQALRLTKPNPPRLDPGIAWVGSGGKTTSLFQLARQLLSSSENQPSAVLVTTTTHLHVNQIPLADSHWQGNTPADFSGLVDSLHGVTLVTGPRDGDRITGLDQECLDWLRETSHAIQVPLLIEADGSRLRPLKAPGDHEPLIPEFVDTVIVVVGMNGLGNPLSEQWAHRQEIFSRLSGLEIGEVIHPMDVVRVLTHPSGGLKGIPNGAKKVVLLNQADSPGTQSQAKAMAEALLPAFDAVVISSMRQNLVHAVYEPVTGIVLAAGEASRYGSPKQLLDWHGKPFIRQVVETALDAGLSRVVVVTGAHAEAISSAIHGLPVTIQYNPDWQKGQSSSIQAGLRAGNLSPDPVLPTGKTGIENRGLEPGAAIFLLADQPQITPQILRALIEEHARSLAPIIAPLVQDQRTNPVMFDRITFPDLMSLGGDVGGRAIFSRFPVTYLPWQDQDLLNDVDTPEDYRKLMDG